MEIVSVRLVNFKCFQDSGEIPISSMTTFIGENDCGKTSILQAIDIFLSKDNKPISTEIFHKIDGVTQQTCSLEICFGLSNEDENNISKEMVISKIFKGENKKTLRVIKKYTATNEWSPATVETSVRGYLFAEPTLNGIDELSSDDLKKGCLKFGIKYTKKEEAAIALKKYVSDNFDSLSKSENTFPTDWKKMFEILPRFELYSKSRMGSPLNLVENTLKMVYRNFFYDTDSVGNSLLKQELAVKKSDIERELDTQLERELVDKIKSTNGKVKIVKGAYNIDFAAGFSLNNLQIDLGSGPNSIDNVGEGTKTRLFLAITEWDREIRAKEHSKTVIRGYDEPDTNLHYEAQREMYYTLDKLSKDKEAKVQVVVCTHSIMMIDRAPTDSIVRIKHKDGVSHPEWLKGSDEHDIKSFISDISGLSGLKNSSLFFERCFLVYEGDTEEKVLPIIYQKATGRTFIEDGIVGINLKTNSAWDVFLKLLSKNKSDATILFLDKDIQSTKKRIDSKALGYVGFSENFLRTNVIFAGQKELEDTFPDELICSCLEGKWPRRDGDRWKPEDILALRHQAKFSQALMDVVSEATYKEKRYTKHDFGEQIAIMMTKDQITSNECLNRVVTLAKSIVS